MKTTQGFSYFLNGEKLKDFDAFEKKIKDKAVTIEVEKLEVRATTHESK